MSWFKRAQSAKPMALPFDRPDKNTLNTDNYSRHPGGLIHIDRLMTQDTADREKQRNPQFLGSGSVGVAVDLGNGRVGKYTDDYPEANFAKWVKDNPVPCVVRVYDVINVQKQNTDPASATRTEPIWMIVMDRVQTLSPSEIKIANDYAIHGWRQQANDNLNEAGFRSSHEFALKKYPQQKDFIDRLFNFAKQLTTHGINTDDARGENIGYDKQGNLVLIDLGSTYSSKGRVRIPVQ